MIPTRWLLKSKEEKKRLVEQKIVLKAWCEQSRCCHYPFKQFLACVGPPKLSAVEKLSCTQDLQTNTRKSEILILVAFMHDLSTAPCGRGIRIDLVQDVRQIADACWN